MTLVVDASVVVAALTDDGPEGAWAASLLTADSIAAPHLILVEVAHALHRLAVAGQITSDTASIAHAELLDIPLALSAYVPLAARVWNLRGNVTAYDAWYVALAESLDANLATLDLRLARAPGLRCAFLTPS